VKKIDLLHRFSAICRAFSIIACLLLTLLAGPSSWVAAEDDTQAELSSEALQARSRLTEALEQVCLPDLADPAALGQKLNAQVTAVEAPAARGMATVIRWSINYPDRATIRLDFIRVQDVLRQVVLRYAAHAVEDGSKPIMEVMADADCVVQRGREIVYDADVRIRLVAVDAGLDRGQVSDPFNPPLRTAKDRNESTGSDRVVVAVVDSGVDYRFDRLLNRLSRDASGNLIGYDYWDDDPLPFDSNPARTPFYPQRHGTRVANIIVEESNLALIAPYRYPRTHPERFSELIQDIVENDIRIVNLSMGSKKESLWQSFERAARAQSDILFIVSAGNEGIDIDEQPVYPAAFPLDNMLTVTSSRPDGGLADGSNRGTTAVDILVEGEEVLTYGFADRLRTVSGSSYAVARVSALASCLLADNPKQTAVELKRKITNLASQPPDPEPAVTQFGYIRLADVADRGRCEVESEQLRTVARHRLSEAAPRFETDEENYGLSLTAVLVARSGWSKAQIRQTIDDALAILHQCRVRPGAIDLIEVSGPRSTRLMSDESMRSLSEFVQGSSLRLFFVEETLREIEFGAEAIGRVNARRRPWLRDTVWMTRWVPDPAQSLAHEIFHVLADSGLHKKDPFNLMAEFTDAVPDATASAQGEPVVPILTPSQCGQLRNIGLGNGLLERR